MTEENHAQTYLHGRLERLELKIDRLVEAVTQIARLEERIGQSLDKTARLEEEIQSVRDRCAKLERDGVRTGVYTGMIERIVYQAIGLIAAALVGAAFVWIRAGGAG